MIIISIISFYLEFIIQTIISKNSLFIPLFINMLLIVLYPYIYNKKKLLLLAFIIGLIFDITYTQTLFINSILLIISAILVIIFYKYISNNMINTIILSIIIISIYRLLAYLIYIFTYNDVFRFNLLFKSIYSSLIINILYVLIFSYILKKINKNKRKLNQYSYIK